MYVCIVRVNYYTLGSRYTHVYVAIAWSSYAQSITILVCILHACMFACVFTYIILLLLCIITYVKCTSVLLCEQSLEKGLLHTTTEIQFMLVRKSFTHALSRNIKHLTIDGQVCFHRLMLLSHENAFPGPEGHQ